MYNLTQEQKKVLVWMNKGNTFDVCSDYCPDQGKILPTYPLAPNIIKRTVHKLRREGLIHYQTVQTYGVRWDRFSLTLKGKVSICSKY
ncbi:hypothetical protein [Photobacterium sanguinicancri]|uniref:hypothetical protein n=1 Tax=Photobacterium sanguinicancri TaxID=875932 RepID=UPI0024808589|nr:hypothetical protein [Photobacterium sanguinicancri]